MTEWCKSWKEKGWKNSAGRSVENQDIIKPILLHLEEREMTNATTQFIWLKGHAQNVGNTAADAHAVKGSRARAEITTASASLTATQKELDDFRTMEEAIAAQESNLAARVAQYDLYHPDELPRPKR